MSIRIDIEDKSTILFMLTVNKLITWVGRHGFSKTTVDNIDEEDKTELARPKHHTQELMLPSKHAAQLEVWVPWTTMKTRRRKATQIITERKWKGHFQV